MKNLLEKKVSNRWAVLAMILAVIIPLGVQARVNNSDTVVALSQTNDNVASRVILPAITAATSSDLVKLSDTTNFKHFNSTGVIEVSQIRVSWTTDVIATTTLKFGTIASTSASGAVADVYWFDEATFTSTEGSAVPLRGRQDKVIDYGNSVVKLGISSALPSGFFSNDKSMADTTFATTTKISSPVGLASAGAGSLPAVGDLVMRVYDQKGTATTSVTVLYRVK